MMSRGSVRVWLTVVLLAALVALPAPAEAGTTFTLSVVTKGAGSGTITSSPSGIDCGASCSWDFPAGTVVTLTAAADALSGFVGWKGGGCFGAGPCDVTTDAATTVIARFASAYRPDAWIKLCGTGDRCRNPGSHHYVGDGVYNASGARQSVSSGVEEENDIRFWILLQNDGTSEDTLYVKGCRGSAGFMVRAVLVGAHSQSEYATAITRQFKAGTAHFSFPPASEPHDVVITLDIWAKTTTAGVGYTCPITVRSSVQPTITDTVVAKMFTCLRNCSGRKPEPSEVRR